MSAERPAIPRALKPTMAISAKFLTEGGTNVTSLLLSRGRAVLTSAPVATPVYHLLAMRTFTLIIGLFAVAASAAAGTHQPSLRLVDDAPLTVQGARFGSSQSVRITVSRAGEIVARRTVRSGSGGGFVARFSMVALHRCDGGGTVTARSATGRFAVAKVPQVECPMPLDPP